MTSVLTELAKFESLPPGLVVEAHHSFSPLPFLVIQQQHGQMRRSLCLGRGIVTPTPPLSPSPFLHQGPPSCTQTHQVKALKHPVKGKVRRVHSARRKQLHRYGENCCHKRFPVSHKSPARRRPIQPQDLHQGTQGGLLNQARLLLPKRDKPAAAQLGRNLQLQRYG